MNINLVLNNDIPPIPDHQNILINDLDNVPASACSSIVVHQTLNYLNGEELTKLISKLRHTGMISISSMDIMQATRDFYRNDLSLNDFSLLIANQKLQHTLLEIKQFLESQQLEVQYAGSQDLYFQIRAKRP
tara:strand:- start:1589 stop:1984 length:396 start_codon:yes stop_codon:yes gene_type:complete